MQRRCVRRLDRRHKVGARRLAGRAQGRDSGHPRAGDAARWRLCHGACPPLEGGRCGPLSVGGRAVGAALCVRASGRGTPGRLAQSRAAAPARAPPAAGRARGTCRGRPAGRVREGSEKVRGSARYLSRTACGKGPRRVREGSRKREVLVEDGLRHRLARRLRGRFREGSREEGIALTLPLPLPLPPPRAR